MKLTNVKAMVAKVFTVGLLAGAVALAAPAKAEAQVAVGVRIGAPPVYGPVYHRPVYVAPPAVGFYGGYYGHPYYGRPYGWDHRGPYFHDRRFYR
jgi:hypothetical protein